MELRYVLVQQAEGICRLTLNRPERLNAINVRVGLELLQAFEDCDRDDNIRVVILTGAGRAFCAGDDLKGMAEPGEPYRVYDDPVKQYVQGEGRWPLVLAKMRALSKPVIGMINGHAHGAGFNLALGCDLRVMADTATLCIPFVKRGIATGTSLLQQFLAGKNQSRGSVAALNGFFPGHCRFNGIAWAPYFEPGNESQTGNVFYGLVRRSVLAQANRIVGVDENVPNTDQGRHPHCIACVI